MKSKLRKLAHTIAKPLVAVISHLQHQTKLSRTENVVDKVKRTAMEDSALYISSNLEGALLFESKQPLWRHALDQAQIPGLNLEFGVWKGNSINFFAKQKPTADFYGFDSFVGLQEDWAGTNLAKGAFNLNGGLPRTEANIKLIKGWFEDTLPNFLNSNKEGISFLHLDADTYISTMYILEQVADCITQGTVLIFDEYLGYPNWRNGEFKAWMDFTNRSNLKFQYLGFSDQAVSMIVI